MGRAVRRRESEYVHREKQDVREEKHEPTVVMDDILILREGTGPVLAVALHAGHSVRPELAEYLVVPEAHRLREEDPFTGLMAPEGVPLAIPERSRFEVDLNRPRERAVYRNADDAWGLDLYGRPLPSEVEAGSLAVYDAAYASLHELLAEAERRHGRFVVLDLHSYNHRRGGALAVPAPEALNPEVNLGTGRFDRSAWVPVVDGFTGAMREAGFDCRENVKFRGGHFSQWVSDNFPDTGVALAIEFKKTYMDEWTGEPDWQAIERIKHALQGAAAIIGEMLEHPEGWSQESEDTHA